MSVDVAGTKNLADELLAQEDVTYTEKLLAERILALLSELEAAEAARLQGEKDLHDEILEAEKRYDLLKEKCEAAERERETFRKDAKTWEGSFRMYRDAWIRELGGWLVPKSHEIDSLVLTMRKRVVNPLLGNCGAPHWLGKPTSDGKALQQTPHPRDSDCREWKVDDSEPNPRAESSEAALRTLREASAWIPVSERLPEKQVYVNAVVKYDNGVVSVAPAFRDSLGKWNSEFEVTHWMPLPEAPKNLAAALAAEGGK